MKTANVFDTKARVVLAFDPEHLQRLDKEQVSRIIDVAFELTKIPGFRGCLPCATSGIDEYAFQSRVLPILTNQQS